MNCFAALAISIARTVDPRSARRRDYLRGGKCDVDSSAPVCRLAPGSLPAR